MAQNTTVIRPSDFVKIVTDTFYRRWSPGALRHVVAALDGAPVIITTDAMTGHSEVGVTLSFHPDHRNVLGITNEFGTVYYDPNSIGETIIPLPATDASGDLRAKWKATESYREECSAALRVAQAKHGDVEGRSYGKWEMKPTAKGVDVSYEPQTGNAINADRWGTRYYGSVSLGDLQAAAGV